MMPLTLAHAGCDDDVIHKLIMAAALFRGRGIDVTVQPWEGAEEALVVTNSLHPYGREVNEIARRRSIPNLTVHHRPPVGDDAGFWIIKDRPAFEYFRLLERALTASAGLEKPLVGAGPVRIETLNRTSAGLLAYGRARVLLEPEAGVCRAGSVWNILTLVEAFRRGRPVKRLPNDGPATNRDIVISLENLVFAALVGREFCHWSGSSTFRLRAWPDIPDHGHGRELATLSVLLSGQWRYFEELVDVAPARVVAAFLHACRVAGLLQENDEAAWLTRPKRSANDGRRSAATGFRRWLGLSGNGSGERDKLLFVGPPGAGKTTAIRSISEGVPVLTEEPIHGGPAGKKSTATMMMEYHYLKLEGDILHLYGLRGTNGLTELRHIPLSDVLGLVLLLDATHESVYGEADAWLGGIRDRYPDLPVAVGVTKTDQSRRFALSRLRALIGAVPVLSVDARDRETLRQLLRLLMLQTP